MGRETYIKPGRASDWAESQPTPTQTPARHETSPPDKHNYYDLTNFRNAAQIKQQTDYSSSAGWKIEKAN